MALLRMSSNCHCVASRRTDIHEASVSVLDCGGGAAGGGYLVSDDGGVIELARGIGDCVRVDVYDDGGNGEGSSKGGSGSVRDRLDAG